MRNSIPLLSIIVCIALLSCKDSATSYSVPEGSGQLNGYVSLRDTMFGKEITAHDYSGVVVSVESGAQSTVTDVDGQFTLSGLPKAKFTLIFSKAGFADSRDVDYDYTGVPLQYYGTKDLYQIRRMTPNITLRPFTGSGDSSAPYKMAVFTSRIIDSLKDQQFSGLIKLYFGKEQSLSPLDPSSFQYITTFTTVDSQDGIVDIGVSRDSLLNYGFQNDMKVYVAAYYSGFYTQNQFFIDKASGKRIYTGLSPFRSELKSFVLP